MNITTNSLLKKPFVCTYITFGAICLLHRAVIDAYALDLDI